MNTQVTASELVHWEIVYSYLKIINTKCFKIKINQNIKFVSDLLFGQNNRMNEAGLSDLKLNVRNIFP